MEHLIEESDIERIQIALVASPSHIPPDTIPKTKDAFHRFPQSWGWRLDDEFKLNILSGEETGKLAKFGVLLQAWLYFGLIFTIVQVNDKPILQYDDLCSGGYLSTKELKKKVEEWVDWEIQNPEGRWIRLIQAGYVLEKARHVVRQNCSCKLEIVGMEVDASEDGTNDGAEPAREGLSAEPHGYFTRTGDARHLTDESALALMLVGECLWAAKSRIIQQCGGDLTGWHTDDDAGWGPPRYILSRMISARWCPRAVFLLKGQLRSSATLLLHAWSTYNGCPDRMVTWHTNCDRNICMARTTDVEGDYTNLCLHQDLNRHEPDQEVCDMVGPEMHEILEVLGSTDHSSRGDSDIPLIRFDCRDDEPIRFAVESLCRQNPQSFATISHVWSDGWGNEKINKLRTCQLRFIRRQLRRANGGKDIPFWMDTLIVPVREFQEGEEMDWDWREKKTKAIAQIFELFAKSSFTVILDNGLCSMPPGLQEKPADAAMKILASGWMRRLWTLHEAFLSKKRYVTFLETADEHNNLINLETLLEHLNTPAAQKSPLVSWVRGLLLQNIMDQEAKILADPEKRFAQRQAAMLVAGTWRAATWRTTSNAAHESLALATLLNVTYKGTEIEEAGLTMSNTDDKLTRLVCEFWREFHLTYKNCIPAGIIFLPGEKVKVLGYGWAPMTWMSAHEADYPDPLSRWTAETDLLEKKGLLVQYPGFLLHTESRKSREQILGVDQTSTVPKFTFPVDSSLLEWYSVSAADPGPGAMIEHLEGILTSKHPLAIILSRPQPKASPPEIGLLVEVYSIDDEKIRREGDDASRQRYSCQVIRRVHVWRETAKSYLAGPGRNGPVRPRDIDDNAEAAQAANAGDTPHWRIIGGMFTDIKHNCCVGEALSSTQKWIVDGYHSADRGKRKPPNPTRNLSRPGTLVIGSKGKGKDIDRSAPGPSSGAPPANAQQKGWPSMSTLMTLVSGRRKAPSPQARQAGATASTVTTAAANVSTSSPPPPNVPPAPGPGNPRKGKTLPPTATFAQREGPAGPEPGLKRTRTTARGVLGVDAEPEMGLKRMPTAIFNPRGR